MIKDSKLLRAALIFIACTSFIVCGVQPIFMGLVTEQLSLSLDQQGWVVSVEMIGMTLGTLLCPILMKRQGGRSLCLFVGLLCVALSIATAFASTNAMLLLVRLAAGTCAGLVYAYAVSTLGRLPNQDRSFGLMLLLQTPEYSLFSAALPLLAAQSGTVTALCSFGLWYLLICGASLALPRKPAVLIGSGEGTPAQGGSSRTGRSALVGMLFMQIAIYCVWGFIDQLARDQGIDGVDIGWAFGLSAIGGLPGAGLPALLGARVNRQLMIAVGLVAIFVSIAMLTGHTRTPMQLCVALLLINFGWVLSLSYYMALITTNDPTGKLTPLVSITLMGAAAVTPALIALLVEGSNQQLIFLLGTSALVVAFAITCLGGWLKGAQERLSASA
ncbi:MULTISPECIES: MFS transporter [Pseudomonas]|uniref:Putative 3-hydroxyphenylpropionic transporter MhpT n=1 Tax=Pseudomonas putida TaxID=303 RepID=A0A1B2F5C7_PSEPU|nr:MULTISPECIES: MFS transporter [Pseudomonas]ANY87326.1 putative 3-hydroxyphenylpropionic transporter MhpT [Pseudomonas putida]MCL8305057.1 MFS transporter [Pseudomonas putida]